MSQSFAYYAKGKLVRCSFGPVSAAAGAAGAARRRSGGGSRASAGSAGPADVARKLLGGGEARLRSFVGVRGSATARFHEPSVPTALVARFPDSGAAVIPTETFVVENPSKSVRKWLRGVHGAEVIEERGQGKLLFRVAGEDGDRVAKAIQLARAAVERGGVDAAHPNFLRVLSQVTPSTSAASSQWNLDNNGAPGVWGADVHAHAAWTETEGSSAVSVAVLDEGVDSLHPDLKPAMKSEKDFVDGHAHARPDGNDAHGTACAGIIASRSSLYPGLAPKIGLIGVRIAKDDGTGNWIFDDFETADAIDWAWKQGAAVLSNSWGGGPPVDVISNAFERARTLGRGGKGCVIAIAAGNNQGAVHYPGTLPNVLTVGASNEWDQRKTKTSQDGEYWWGSNYGAALDLLAPGVHIPTTDIHGANGYSSGNMTMTFNGTSSATPHVAAAAALILSVKSKLTEAQVRDVIKKTAERLPGQSGWTQYNGDGRLNCYAAVRAARRM